MVTTDMLTANPDNARYFFGMNDPAALGAVLAVEQASKAGAIKVTGVDGSPKRLKNSSAAAHRLLVPPRKTWAKWCAGHLALLRIWLMASILRPLPY